jgi:hypothetical protein
MGGAIRLCPFWYQEVVMKFPTVTGSNLSGKRYNLPQDFEGQYNIVVVVYQRFQQSSVDTWGALLEQLARQYPDLRYYELPTLPNYGWLQKNIIDGGMRGGIPDNTVRSRTITLYIDVNKFNASLNLATLNDIYVLVTDRQGEVMWQTNGICTAPKADALSQKLAELFA